MVAHEKRNSAQLFCAVPTRNDLALSSLLFPAQPTQKLEYPIFPPFRREKRAGTAALRVLRQKGRKIEETEMCYRFTASVRRGNNIFCKNIRDRVAFKKKYDYNKLFSMFGTTI